MLYRSQTSFNSTTSFQHTFLPYQITPTQHGSFLLDIPHESLTHITCYLDPRSLYDLSRACRALLSHVMDDNTWRRAFAFQLLNISPENNFDGEQAVLLRRSEPSWKQEFIRHDHLRRRWAKSHSGAVTHSPHHAAISDVHLMPSHALLSASLAYGIVARSHPLKGSVVRGFFEPSGTGPGAGNPNAEFAPNVSACALASQGNTARIAWGLGHGEVRVTLAVKAMEPSAKTSAKWIHCAVTDEHQGSISDICWDGTRLVSAGTDAIVKVWESADLRCIWSSSKPVMPAPLVKVVSALDNNIIVATRSNGDLVIWDGVGGTSVIEAVIACPCDGGKQTIHSLFLDCSTNHVTILTSYTDNAFVHVFRSGRPSSTTTFVHKSFGDEAFGPIRSVQPYFSETAAEKNFILVGDSLGGVSIYDPEQLTSVRRFEAFEDGDIVTALARNGVVLVAGSAKGVVRIFDGYTLEALRTFTFPPPRYRRGTDKVKDPVSRILLSKDQEVMVVSAGDSVMGWLAGPVARSGRNSVRGRALGSPSKKKAKNTNAKYREQIELNQSIRESKQAIEHEKKVTQEGYVRRRAQMSKLDTLGLNEAEAIEYLLMVSREEEEARQRSSQDLMFEDDIPNFDTPVTYDSSPVTPSRRTPMHDDYDDFPSISPNSIPRVSPPSVWGTPTKSREWAPSSAGSSAASYQSGPSFEEEDDEDLRLAIRLSLQEV